MRTSLANGMQVIVLPDRLAPVATVVLEYGVGFDDDTMPGIAHATEHMMYRGTSDISAGQFADIADRMGAEYDAATENEFTYYYFKLPSPYVGVALHLEADRMTKASIRESDWTTERKAIEQEIRAHESVPGYKVGLKLRKLFYGDSILAQASAGTVASFEKMTAADIASFYHAWYHPDNATLIVAGDVDPQQVLAQVHDLFDGIASVPLPPRPSVTVSPLTSTTLNDSIELPIPVCALMYRTPGTADADYAASLVVSQVLNNDRGGMADLAASGKILGALTISSALPEIGSSFVVGVPAMNAAPGDAAQLLSGVLADYRTSGIPHDLIAASTLRLISEQAYAQASISGLAFRWAETIGLRQSDPGAIFDAVAGLTDADINRVFRTYYTPAHQITALLRPTSFSAMPKTDAKAGAEDVRYTPSVHEPLPAWAIAALDVPLKVPQSSAFDTVVRLKNGLTVVVRSESVAPTVTVKGEIEMNPQLYEPPGRDGVADLTNLLLPWGTTSYDRKAYDAQLDAIAASLSLGDSFDLTVTSQHFDRAMQLLADGMLRPAFPQAGFDVLKGQLMQAVAAGEKLPSTQASIAEMNALYPPGDPRRRHTTLRSVQGISLGNVRRWYTFAYRPDLTTIAIVGDVSPSQAQAIVRKYFGDWRAVGKRPDFRYPPLPKRSAKGETITVKSPSAAQSEVTLKQIIDVQRADSEYVPLLLANTMLSGEGTGSLLFKELRTRDGYVYNVDSDFDIDREGATFTITYASDPKDVDRAQAAAVAVIKRLQSVPLDDVELQRAKALLLAQRVLPLDSYGGVATHLLEDQRYAATAERTDSFWKALVATTPQQIRDAMRRCLRPDRFLRVIVAPTAG